MEWSSRSVAMNTYIGSQSSAISSCSVDSLKNCCQISPLVRNHLAKVYLALCCVLVASGVGFYLHILFNIGGIFTGTAFLASMDGVLQTPQCDKKRVILLMATGIFQGASVGPMIIQLDPSFLLKSMVVYAVAFVCSSVVAILAKRGQYLQFGGFLYSYGFLTVIFSLLTHYYLGNSASFFKLVYSLVILLLAGYTVVDTQRIIEKAHLGDLDYMKDALTLFLDLAAVVYSIYMTMLKDAAGKKKKRGG